MFRSLKASCFFSYDASLFFSFCHTGTAPNITRNAIVNCTELVTYDFIKDMLLRSTPLTGKIQ